MKYKEFAKLVIGVVAILIAGIFYVKSIKTDEQPVFESDNKNIELESTDKEYNESFIQEETKVEWIYVQVCGQVNEPGVYKVSTDSRVYEVISMAGGMTQDAMINGVNQAETLQDGQQIYVPSVGEETISYSQNIEKGGGKESSKVNINTANEDELKTLPGIGDSRAAAIIAYREDNGSFAKIEDIKNVSGIKDAAFDKIKDLISV